MKENRREKKGYTLIELMIVIVIIGILTTIILPHMVKGRYQAQFTNCQANERNMASALEIYHTDKGGYPQSSAEFRDNIFKASSGNPPYMQPEPRCPSNNSQYGYTVDTSDYHNFTLNCNGIHHLIIKSVKAGFPQYAPTRGLMFE
ncbi:MAG: prepilin-type N-terminal cleavage/methylation domain-containing protein [Firmicutes bacterium]|nr:prepilin-type N-terminal cleavage/methylation domain-containing protein [Bacillota bacterium]